MLRALQATALLLTMVDCMQHYRIKRVPSLTVSPSERGEGSQAGIVYRVAAYGMNSCCSIHVDIVNQRTEPLVLLPGTAALASPNCTVSLPMPSYHLGSGADSLAALDELRSNGSFYTGVVPKLKGRDEQLSVPAHGYVSLSYYNRAFTKSCAPYSFTLRAGDDVTIAATFEPD